MPLEARLFVGLAIAVAVVHLTTPLAIRVAERLQFYDRPVGYKGHVAPTPYLGGAAVVAGFLVALLLLAGHWDRTLPVVGGVLILWAVGTVDDRRTLPPLTRVAIEVVLAAGLWALGLGWDLGLGAALDLLLTAVWIVAVVNAFNLFDNMDGAASTMAAVVAAGLAVVGVVEGDTWLAVTGAALCGAALGFLPHNLFASPARIFLGDGGSMPLGFAVAATAMIGMSASTAAWQSLAMGLLLVGIPALDTALVTVSRRRRGVSILTGGRDHLTHRARRRLRNARAVAVTLGGAQAVISALAIVALRNGSAGIVVAVVAYLVGLGATIALLDARFETAQTDATPGDAAEGSRAGAEGRRVHAGSELPAIALLVALAVGIGISPFFFGYYDATIWVPAGLGLLGIATAGAIARPPRVALSGRLVIGGLAAIGVWALISSLWADSIEQAVIEGNRWLAYAALALVLAVLIRSRRAALAALATLGLTAVAVGLVVLVRMAGASASELFLAGRLHEPLGYINGMGGYFVLGAWLCVAAAERREPLVAGAGAGGAALLAGLALLSQSRGVALAGALSVLVVVLAVPGRTRRGWALLVIGAAVGAAAPPLLDLYAEANGGAPEADLANRAAQRLAVLSARAAAVWGAAVWLERQYPARAQVKRIAAGALAAGVLVAAAVGVASAGWIADTARALYDAFVSLSAAPPQPGDSRLVSGAGNRYDYFRVAWNAFEDEPLRGVGAGNYDRRWFAERRVAEDVRQPHSVGLQMLGELGVAGLGLLLVVLGGIAWAGVAACRLARTTSDARTIAVAGLGLAVAWLVHTSVDWLHLLPGLTATMLTGVLCMVAVAPPRAERGRARVLPFAVALLIAVAAVSLARQVMTERFVDAARGALAADPAKALRDADRALRLDPEVMAAYYVKAAALARFGEGDAARATLRAAVAKEPGEYVTWALLGDLEVRRGDIPAARRAYRRAQAINPREPSLPGLIADPRSALSSP